MEKDLAKQLESTGFKTKYHTGDVENGKLVAVPNPSLSELLDAVPMRQKYLGTVNDAHFVLRKLVTSSKINQYWAYYEDEDTEKPIEGYSFRGEQAKTVIAKLLIALKVLSTKQK